MRVLYPKRYLDAMLKEHMMAAAAVHTAMVDASLEPIPTPE
jgi:hypothetical protein